MKILKKLSFIIYTIFPALIFSVLFLIRFDIFSFQIWLFLGLCGIILVPISITLLILIKKEKTLNSKNKLLKYSASPFIAVIVFILTVGNLKLSEFYRDYYVRRIAQKLITLDNNSINEYLIRKNWKKADDSKLKETKIISFFKRVRITTLGYSTYLNFNTENGDLNIRVRHNIDEDFYVEGNIINDSLKAYILNPLGKFDKKI